MTVSSRLKKDVDCVNILFVLENPRLDRGFRLALAMRT